MEPFLVLIKQVPGCNKSQRTRSAATVNCPPRRVLCAGRTFTPLEVAPDHMRRTTGKKGQLRLETRGSKFAKFQEVKLQELACEVRSMIEEV